MKLFYDATTDSLRKPALLKMKHRVALLVCGALSAGCMGHHTLEVHGSLPPASASQHVRLFVSSNAPLRPCDEPIKEAAVEETGSFEFTPKHQFPTRFGWLNDRFGVSWQLNLAA